MPDEVYVERTVQLEPGDRLCLFTDGVTDCRDELGAAFGHERLSHLLQSHASAPAGAIAQHIVTEMKEFCGTAKPVDDVTLLVAEIR